MPLYDYLYGTVDKSSDTLYESASEGTFLCQLSKKDEFEISE